MSFEGKRERRDAERERERERSVMWRRSNATTIKKICVFVCVC